MNGGAEIKVEEQGSKRVLKYNGITYSLSDSNSIYTHMYWDFFIPLPLLFEKPRILLIGLGGGTIAYQLTTLYNGNIILEISEINRVMVERAKEFTGIDISRFTLYLEDGAEVVKRKKNAYEIIILDAYINDRIPKQFLQEDFISNAYTALSDKGILAINYANKLSLFFEYIGYKQRLRKYFDLYILKKGIGSRNSILLASKTLTGAEIFAIIKSKMQQSLENQFLINAYSEIIK